MKISICNLWSKNNRLPREIAKRYLMGGVLMTKKHLFSRLQIKVCPKGLHSFAFYILIFDFPPHLPLMSLPASTYVLTRCLYNCKETFTDVMSALQIKLFLQNKAKFRKSQMNVNKVLTKDYDKKDTWSIGKNEPKTNPKRTQIQKGQNEHNFYYNKGL